ncbi:xanthine dehydrogenase [Chloropicon primus]|uniref:Xanthine dehydrogenase n=3 Tax=Chloropicon primus TaxID=1764295 RepID=A0A5B8MVV2_9CHLO|nr:xanthine dehydrogenase [Chloropicon primus]UPR03877.1 xanthine dehydrogenase [Chloropicon primus]|eukprot:QDZ24669.1 xanthine dehydrogenase [Chloropicon primus]
MRRSFLGTLCCCGVAQVEKDDGPSVTPPSSSNIPKVALGFPEGRDVPVLQLNVNGETYLVEDPDPEMLLVDWLRGMGLTGTKKSCGEGGCGACTVMLQRSLDGEWTKGKPINSCLCPLVSLDGARVTTIEGVGSKEKGFHPIQKKLAECNGSQCGFCSPGFVMNMYSLLQENSAPTPEDIENRFEGNICRCTGYRPILDAFHSIGGDIEDIANGSCKANCGCSTDCRACEKQKPAKAAAARTEKEKKGLTFYRNSDGTKWTQPTSLSQLCDLMTSSPDFVLVASNTGLKGVEKYYSGAAWGKPTEKPSLLINISKVQELSFVQENSNGVELGALTTLSEAIESLQEMGGKGATLSDHIKKVASHQVRSVATVGGNLSLHWKHNAFPSDLVLILAGAGASVSLVDPKTNKVSWVAIERVESINGLVLRSVLIPSDDPGDTVSFKTFRISKRHQNAHAIVNAAFQLKMDDSKTIKDARIFYGGVGKEGLHSAPQTETLLTLKRLNDNGLLQQALQSLKSEVVPNASDRQKKYKENLVLSFFYKFFLGVKDFQRPVSQGTADFEGAENKDEFPISSPIPKRAALTNTSGETLYVDDLPSFESALHCSFVLSQVGCCESFEMDYSQAVTMPGVSKIIDASLLSAVQNSVSPSGEPLFALPKAGIAYAGQRLALVVADSELHAESAANAIKVTYNSPSNPILTIEDAIQKKSFYNSKPETFGKGDASAAMKASDVKLSGTASCGHQHHFYMEVQTAAATVSSDGVKVCVSTQGPGLISDAVSSALGLAKSQVEVVQGYAGGAYGGKSSKSIPCALAASLASHFTMKPCKIRLELNKNLLSLGSRRPHRFDYEVGCTKDGKINAISGTVYYQQGAYLDFGDLGGLDVLQMSIDGAYNIENWSLCGYECKTNTPGNTFCRGPVFLPGTFLIESVLDHVAFTVGADAETVKALNLYNQGDVSLAGQKLVDCHVRDTFDLCLSKSDFGSRAKAVEDFNANNALMKKGLAVCPSKYMMNPCTGFPALVSIYEDASVLIQHSGCEIGQGLNIKAIQTAAYELGVDCGLVSCSATSSWIAGSHNVTGGSTTSEAICASTLLACQELKERIRPVKEKNPSLDWPQLIAKCYQQGVDMAARSVYTGQKEPGVLPDGQDNGPSPYVSYGCAAVEVLVDVLTGEVQILRVDVIQDNGISLNTAVDVGQIQGSFVMGLGYMLTEEFVWDEDGANVANGTWEYKPFSSLDIPIEFNATLLPNSPNSHGVLGSKSVGEPPLILSAAAVSAVRKAIQSLKQNSDDFCFLSAPATVEKIQLACNNNLLAP